MAAASAAFHGRPILSERSTFEWNALLRRSTPLQAIALYAHSSLRSGAGARALPNKFTFICLLRAASAANSSATIPLLHAHLTVLGLHADLFLRSALITAYSSTLHASSALYFQLAGHHPDVVLRTTLVSALARCGLPDAAREVFDAIPDPTPVSIAAIVSAYASAGRHADALSALRRGRRAGVPPTESALVSALSSAAHLGSLTEGELIHRDAVVRLPGCTLSPVLGTALLNMYSKCGRLESARKVFDEMSQRDQPLWAAMICALSQNDRGNEALHLFAKMLGERIEPNRRTITSVLSACSQLKEVNLGRMLHGYCFRTGLLDWTDVVLQTALVDMYSKCRKLSCALGIFNRMTKRNLVSWNSIINGYFFNGSFEVALDLFKELVSEDWRLQKSSILATVLNICGLTTDLRKGKEVHGFVLKHVQNNSDKDNLIVYNAVLHMYVKTGNMESAVLLFESMLTRNVVTWTVMISCYGAYGMGRKALQLLEMMKQSGVRPDGVTFVSVLSACSHGGLVDEGQDVYNSMKRYYQIVPDMMHFVCMVDLYGRSGLHEKAHDFIKMMPVKPDKFIWISLLSSCRNHKNLELGEYAARKALELDRYDTGTYLLLSRLYADAGMWENLAKVRYIMKELGLHPETACSWVELKGKVYKFTVADHKKAISAQIYEFLLSIRMAMKKVGLTTDASCVGHMMKEQRKVMDLCGHTEKLALAVSLMKGGNLIRIGKNLRVCADCHNTFKFVSATYNKEIVLKDPNRYHRFYQGSCSCGDFW